jgi:D-aminopeptidase
VGEELDPPAWWASHHPEPAGSCLGVVVTDAPLDAAAASRVAARVGLGLARCGSVAHHGSGEIFCCLATGLRAPRGQAPKRNAWPGSRLDDLFEATVDATESAVWDSLLAATTTTGRRGLTVPALPADLLGAI